MNMGNMLTVEAFKKKEIGSNISHLRLNHLFCIVPFKIIINNANKGPEKLLAKEDRSFGSPS